MNFKNKNKSILAMEEYNWFHELPTEIQDMIHLVNYEAEHKVKMKNIFKMINTIGKVEDYIDYNTDYKDHNDEGRKFCWWVYGEEIRCEDWVMWLKNEFYELELEEQKKMTNVKKN